MQFLPGGAHGRHYTSSPSKRRPGPCLRMRKHICTWKVTQHSKDVCTHVERAVRTVCTQKSWQAKARLLREGQTQSGPLRPGNGGQHWTVRGTEALLSGQNSDPRSRKQHGRGFTLGSTRSHVWKGSREPDAKLPRTPGLSYGRRLLSDELIP